jgi:chemosensory pili system protein ChpA (sensor histidine kinase/response regulator)
MSNAASAKAFIMVIDDSRTVRKVLQVVLARAGYAGATFADGVTAIRWLQGPGSHIPDLVFLDLCLPHLNGYQVVRSLRSLPQCQYTRIVMLTRRDSIFDRLQARLAGVNSYLTKPFTQQEILCTAQHQLAIRSKLCLSMA